MNPSELKYTNQHEWVGIESGNTGIVGFSHFAAEELGDIVFLELPDVDTEVTQAEQFGEVESVKAVAEIYSPVSGRVIARNEEAIDNPEVVNEDPYENGWLIKVEISDASELDNLMTSDQYEEFLKGQEGH